VKFGAEFQTFLMFRPQGEGDESIWVPLKMETWGFMGDMSRGNTASVNNWPEPRLIVPPHHENMQTTKDFPEWNWVINRGGAPDQYDWVGVPS